MEIEIVKTERWRKITEFPQYHVSDKGRVKSVFNTDRKCKSIMSNPEGLKFVRLYDKGRPRDRYIHKLVATEFLGYRKGDRITWADKNRMNNTVENLIVVRQET